MSGAESPAISQAPRVFEAGAQFKERLFMAANRIGRQSQVHMKPRAILSDGNSVLLPQEDT